MAGPVGGVFDFGDWRIDSAANRLERDGQAEQIEPLAMDVLVVLLEHPGEVVSQDTVLDRVWGGGSGDPGMVKKRVAQIRRALGDDPKHPRYIETIAKRGYRAIAPVRVAAIPAAVDHGSTIEAAGEIERYPAKRAFRLRYGFVAAAVLAIALALSTWYATDSEPENVDPNQTTDIAVAPFEPVGEDAALQAYASLIRDELVTHLTRLFSGRRYLVEDAAAADYLVTGRLTTIDEGVQLFVQIEGNQPRQVIWARAMPLPDAPSDELLATRPEQLATILWMVATLWPAASNLTDSIPAVRAYIEGMIETSELWQGIGGDWNAAFAHFRQAHELDPQFTWPLDQLSNLYVNRLGGRLRWQEAVGPAREYTRKKLAIAPDDTAHLGWLNVTMDLDYAAALANTEHARLNGHPPGLTEFTTGFVKMLQGELNAARDHFHASLRLGALSNKAAIATFLAMFDFVQGDYSAALSSGENAVLQTEGTGNYAHLSAQYIYLGAMLHIGERARAEQKLDALWERFGGAHPEDLVGLLAMFGREQQARAVLTEAEERWRAGKPVNPVGCLFGHHYLGDVDQTFVWMRRAIEDRQTGLIPHLRHARLFDSIRSDPRFAAAMARLAAIEAEGTPIRSVAYP